MPAGLQVSQVHWETRSETLCLFRCGKKSKPESSRQIPAAVRAAPRGFRVTIQRPLGRMCRPTMARLRNSSWTVPAPSDCCGSDLYLGEDLSELPVAAVSSSRGCGNQFGAGRGRGLSCPCAWCGAFVAAPACGSFIGGCSSESLRRVWVLGFCPARSLPCRNGGTIVPVADGCVQFREACGLNDTFHCTGSDVDNQEDSPVPSPRLQMRLPLGPLPDTKPRSTPRARFDSMRDRTVEARRGTPGRTYGVSAVRARRRCGRAGRIRMSPGGGVHATHGDAPERPGSMEWNDADGERA